MTAGKPRSPQVRREAAYGLPIRCALIPNYVGAKKQRQNNQASATVRLEGALSLALPRAASLC